MRIDADREVCCGSGMCALTAPDVFDQDEDDGRVVVIMPEPDADQEATAREAVELCPSGALSATDRGAGSDPAAARAAPADRQAPRSGPPGCDRPTLGAEH
jgi:ferredoxin